MKHSSGLVIIFICLILSGLTGIVTADSASYDKSVSISMNIDNGKITTTSTDIYYGSAPNLFPMQEGLMGELVAADGSIVKTFTVRDPRVQFGDVIVTDANGPQVRGIVDQQNPVDFVVITPFNKKVTEFRLYTSEEGTLLASVNLKPTTDSFFAVYPGDPDNPALSGPPAPVIADTAPLIPQDPGTKSSDQLLGLQAIGSGAVLLLGGGFASIRFLRKRSKSVLIVDDNRDIIDVIAAMLKIGGYTPRAATSGKECLKELESAVPDLILLDIGMEPMNGWETLKEIKKNPATKDILVIMLTAQKLIPRDVENYGIFIEDYIVKPVTEKSLKDAVMHVFARQQMIEEKIAAAKGTGIDRNELHEWAHLIRAVDVNKRLWDLLTKTYNLESGVMEGADNEITHAIKNIEETMWDQKHRLEKIQRNLGSSMCI